MSNSTSTLKWKIFVTPAVPTVSDDLPRGETTRMWSPISSIPIHGECDAMLVDTPTTAAQAVALADWVDKSGKNLRTICTTHGHGDHFFGNRTLLDRFPATKANDVHQYFGDSLTHAKRMEWISVLDGVEALKTSVVIAGHKRESNSDGPNIIEETRQYIRDFDRLVDKTPRRWNCTRQC